MGFRGRKLQETWEMRIMRRHNIYSSPGIIRVTETRRMGWARHVARVLEKRNAYVGMVGETNSKS